MAVIAAFAIRYTGYRLPMVIGYGLSSVGLFGLSVQPLFGTPYGWLALTAALTGVGMGIATPASNNATLQTSTGDVAAIAGLRAMYRHTGSITAVSISTAIAARASDPGLAQARVFAVFAAVLACVLPLILFVPDHRGAW
jgi:hypothetical protein